MRRETSVIFHDIVQPVEVIVSFNRVLTNSPQIHSCGISYAVEPRLTVTLLINTATSIRYNGHFQKSQSAIFLFLT